MNAEKQKRSGFAYRVGAGALAGASFAVFLVPLLVGAAIVGSWELPVRNGVVHVGVLLITYPLGGALSGAVFAGFGPMLPGRILPALLGGIALIPWMAGCALAYDHGYEHWTTAHTYGALLGAIGLGVPLGYVAPDWWTPKRKTRKGPTPSRRERSREARSTGLRILVGVAGLLAIVLPLGALPIGWALACAVVGALLVGWSLPRNAAERHAFDRHGLR